MAKKKEQQEEKKHVAVVNKKSLSFLEKYINNPSPTGFEWEGQKIWLDYIQQELDRRKPGQSEITTSRNESDTVEFLSGIFLSSANCSLVIISPLRITPPTPARACEHPAAGGCVVLRLVMC